MTANGHKIRVDMSLLDGYDYVAIEEATGKPISEVLGTARGIYAAAWRARVRDDPAATLDDTMRLPLSAFDMVNPDEPAGKAAASTGGGPPGSLASGT